ncbi:MAG: tetratricopeptide repeat protein, partial [Candidatus Acidiferrales bacterium]
SDLPRAIQYFQTALKQNPRSDLYWLHLASAYEAAGDPVQAREAYGQAKAAYPISAEVAWNYGNFLLRQSQIEEGFQEIRRAAVTDPHLLPLAISRGWQADSDLDHLFNNLIPRSADAYFQALDYFCSVHEDDPALNTWKRIIALGEAIPLARSFPFLDELIAQGKSKEAQEVWRQAINSSGWPHTEPTDGSLIWNGGFESPIANGGLGWREDYVFGAAMSIDTATFHSGSHSLRVDFSGGANVDFHHLTQMVPVEPQTRYHFSGYLRTEEISTENGMRFRIIDPKHSAELTISTDDLIRTNPWTLLDAGVMTGPDTHFLLIEVQRDTSRLFDNKLSGTVWVDDVSLTPLPESGKAGSR